MPEFNDAFWRWFGASKVVDAQGQPLRVYHGTRAKFTKFRRGKGKIATFISVEEVERYGFFFAEEKEFAQAFAGKDGTVLAAYLSLQNPVDLRYAGDEFDTQMELRGINRKWLLWGEMWEKFDEEDGKKFVAFHPTQIKSATGNDGTWDVDDPDITSNPSARLSQKRMQALAAQLNAEARNGMDGFLTVTGELRAHRDPSYAEVRLPIGPHWTADEVRRAIWEIEALRARDEATNPWIDDEVPPGAVSRAAAGFALLRGAA